MNKAASMKRDVLVNWARKNKLDVQQEKSETNVVDPSTGTLVAWFTVLGGNPTIFTTRDAEFPDENVSLSVRELNNVSWSSKHQVLMPYPCFDDVDDAAMYLHDNWTRVTGEPKKTRYEESHWPEGAERFIDHVEACMGCDFMEFQDAWTYLRG